MKYTKKIYRRGRNQGRTRKTAIRKEPITAQERKEMSPTGKSIARGLEQAIAYVDGTADKSRYRVHPAKKVTASRKEKAGIRRGCVQIKRGEYVTLDELIKDKKAFAKEARRQSRMLRGDPQEQELLEEFDWLNAEEADKMGWKC